MVLDSNKGQSPRITTFPHNFPLFAIVLQPEAFTYYKWEFLTPEKVR